MKQKIEIDVSVWPDSDGIMASVWLGDMCEPAFEQTFSYEESIDQTLELCCVHGRIATHTLQDAEEFIKKLEEAAAYARKKFEELKSEDN